MTIQRTIAEFSEGMAEIFVVAIVIVLEKAFTSIPLPGANWGMLTNYIAMVFIISFIWNIIKGIIFPLDAFVNILGMILGLFIAGAVIWQIAPGAVIELVLYIIAAVVGIIIGIKIRGERPEQPYPF